VQNHGFPTRFIKVSRQTGRYFCDKGNILINTFGTEASTYLSDKESGFSMDKKKEVSNSAN